ncbi:MAG: hypothetical protein Q4C00_04580, partial [Bacillota bacterium]|nr:hypothetical protein [Bacillota bacterium]
MKPEVINSDKTNLSAAIAKVTGDNAANWYQENDRWNGKEASTNGFWTDMQTVLAVAQAVNANNAASQNQVDEAKDNLEVAIAKLIPKTELNATYLYETINAYKQSEDRLSECTPFTVKAYREALAAAEEYLAKLFLGGTILNKAENQAVADKYADDFRTATFNLTTEGGIEKARDWDEYIDGLDKVFTMKENNGKYSEDSWNALVAVRAEIVTHRADHPITTALTNQGADGYRRLAVDYWDAAYGLEEIGNAEISLYFSDDFGMRYPDHAVTSKTAYSDTITLEGEKTLKSLLNQSGLTKLQGFGYSSPYDRDNLLWDGWLVYINGILVRDPGYYAGTAGHSIVLHDADSQADWNDIKLRNGDVVAIARTEAAVKPTYVGNEGVPFSTLVENESFGLLSVEREETSGVKEGEALEIVVSRSASYISDYTGKVIARANMKLAAYGPQNQDGSYPATPIISDGVTNAQGEGEITLYAAGKYLITAFDPRETDSGEGFFPTVTCGARPIEVVIASLSEAEMEQALSDYLTNLDNLLAQYSEAEFGTTLWKQAQSAYYTAKAAIVAADSLAAAQTPLDTAKTTLDSLEEQARTANNTALSEIKWYFDRLPTASQINAHLFTQGDIDRYNKLVELYSAMSDYQKGHLTTAQIAQYQALAIAYGTDGSTLPPTIGYTLTVQCEPATDGDKITASGFYEARPQIREWTPGVDYDEQSLAQPLTYTVYPGDSTAFTVKNSNMDTHEIYKVTWTGADLEYRIGTYSDASFTLSVGDNFSKSTIGRSDITVTVYVREKGNLSLSERKDEAKAELSEKLGSYDSNAYTSENWLALNEEYRKGIAAIEGAADIDAVTQAKDDAIAAMAAIEKRADDDYGSVTVEIYNNTYAGGLGYHTTDAFISASHDLTATDTMMSIIVDALDDNGYGVTGSESYISGVYQDSNDNGQYDAADETLLA